MNDLRDIAHAFITAIAVATILACSALVSCAVIGLGIGLFMRALRWAGAL